MSDDTTPTPKLTGGGKRSRDKGARVERRIVADHIALGIKSERVPLSGAVRFRNTEKTDVDVYVNGESEDPWVTEVKGRANGAGWKTIADWLGDGDALFLVQDRKAPLVVMPWRRWVDLMEFLKSHR